MIPYFKTLQVVLRRKNGVLSAHVLQNGVLGKNLIPKNQLSSAESAQKVVRFLLQGICEATEFKEE